jgi:hypothetical protein
MPSERSVHQAIAATLLLTLCAQSLAGWTRQAGETAVTTSHTAVASSHKVWPAYAARFWPVYADDCWPGGPSDPTAQRRISPVIIAPPAIDQWSCEPTAEPRHPVHTNNPTTARITS